MTNERDYAQPATEEVLTHTAEALRSHGIVVEIVATGTEARERVLESIPAGAEVNLGSSVTLEQTGIRQALEDTGTYDAVRVRTREMDRKTHADEIRRLRATPAFMLGSVHAVTEDGSVLIASKTGSQLGPYVSGAGKVIWVVGSQKVVRDLTDGMRRVTTYCLPREDARSQQEYGVGSELNKLLIINKEIVKGRITVLLVKEALGV